MPKRTGLVICMPLARSVYEILPADDVYQAACLRIKKF